MTLEILFGIVVMVGFVLFVLWERSRLEKRWSDGFKAISFDLIRETQANWLNQSKNAMESLVVPIKDTLDRYEQVVQGIENKRLGDFAELKSEIRQLVSAKGELQKETAKLVGALSKPSVGGSWGELTLKRVVELAGMVRHCDFEEQLSVSGEDGRFRPDMVIHLPSNRDLVVDAKVSLDTYLAATSASTQEERTEGLKKHAGVMREHLKKLSAKAYWSQFEKSPEFVVMFIPGESFFSAALEHDKALLEDGMERGVILATPSTLVALLRAVAYGWRQEEMGRNAVEIAKLGRELHERLLTWTDHLSQIGEALGKALKAYNSAVGSLESRVLPTARKMAATNLAEGDGLKVLEPLETSTREFVRLARIIHEPLK